MRETLWVVQQRRQIRLLRAVLADGCCICMLSARALSTHVVSTHVPGRIELGLRAALRNSVLGRLRGGRDGTVRQVRAAVLTSGPNLRPRPRPEHRSERPAKRSRQNEALFRNVAERSRAVSGLQKRQSRQFSHRFQPPRRPAMHTPTSFHGALSMLCAPPFAMPPRPMRAGRPRRPTPPACRAAAVRKRPGPGAVGSLRWPSC